MRVRLHICCQMQRTAGGSRWVLPGPCQIQVNCSSADSTPNIQIDVFLVLLKICLQFYAHNSPHIEPNTDRILLFMLCLICFRSDPKQMQFCRFCPKYSNVRISVLIEYMTTIQCAIYSTYATKYSARTPVSAMPTMSPIRPSIIAV